MGDGIRRAAVRYGLEGESHSAMSALMPDQRKRAKSLARELEEKVSILRQENEREVFRAALLLLVDKID